MLTGREEFVKDLTKFGAFVRAMLGERVLTVCFLRRGVLVKPENEFVLKTKGYCRQECVLARPADPETTNALVTSLTTSSHVQESVIVSYMPARYVSMDTALERVQ